jgi:hypothetical protein
VLLGISDGSVKRILEKDLHCHLYKIEIVHALKDVDHANLLAFCQHNKWESRNCKQSFAE